MNTFLVLHNLPPTQKIIKELFNLTHTSVQGCIYIGDLQANASSQTLITQTQTYGLPLFIISKKRMPSITKEHITYALHNPTHTLHITPQLQATCINGTIHNPENTDILLIEDKTKAEYIKQRYPHKTYIQLQSLMQNSQPTILSSIQPYIASWQKQTQTILQQDATLQVEENNEQHTLHFKEGDVVSQQHATELKLLGYATASIQNQTASTTLTTALKRLKHVRLVCPSIEKNPTHATTLSGKPLKEQHYYTDAIIFVGHLTQKHAAVIQCTEKTIRFHRISL